MQHVSFQNRALNCSVYMPRRALENWQFNKLKHILSFTSRSDSSFTFNNLIYITSSQNTHVTIKLSFPIIYFSVRAFFFIQEQQKKNSLPWYEKKLYISHPQVYLLQTLFLSFIGVHFRNYNFLYGF